MNIINETLYMGPWRSSNDLPLHPDSTLTITLGKCLKIRITNDGRNAAIWAIFNSSLVLLLTRTLYHTPIELTIHNILTFLAMNGFVRIKVVDENEVEIFPTSKIIKEITSIPDNIPKLARFYSTSFPDFIMKEVGMDKEIHYEN